MAKGLDLTKRIEQGQTRLVDRKESFFSWMIYK